MSGVGGEGRSSPNSDIEICAAEWISRQQFDTWNDAEHTKLDAWLAEADNHAAAYWRLKATWDRTNRLSALRRPEGEAVIAPIQKRRWRIFAASFTLIAAIVGAAAYLFPPGGGETFSTAIGGHTALTLADGSKVDLNTDTILRAEIGTHARNVELVRGEAYFQIKHDAARPFVVTVAGHRITDLGTKFFVRMVPKGLEVALIEGRARLDDTNTDAGKRHSAVLTPGDLARATADSMSVSRKRAPELADDLAWRRGALVFHNASLADAAAAFNRYGGVKLIIVDPGVAALTINGTFRTNGADELAGVAHEIFGLRIARVDRNIVLTR
jgi:transmembrane sensor